MVDIAHTGVDDTRISGARADFHRTLTDLSSASVARNFDPYLDIAWDSPELAIDPTDPRWVLHPELDYIGRSPWYQAQPLEKRIAMGIWRQANLVKAGLQFEQVLIAALMQYSFVQRNGSPEFRYATHEAREECNHTLMFQEFVNRTGQKVPGAPRWFRAVMPRLTRAAVWAPPGFFVGVLGGEEPIDHMQKHQLRAADTQHPAMTAIIAIHVAEEARHISFAHQLLEYQVPKMSRVQRGILSIVTPLVMWALNNVIMVPPKQFWETFDVPDEVRREIFWRDPATRRMRAEVFGDVRALAERIGLMNPVSRRVWSALGIGGRASRFRGEPQYEAI
ncbi:MULTISPECIES: AurF N-oxygenase family protein [Tsukamurella]|uniref:Diiron oxygenase n=2 Tax=Tsukamurella TaxID=2060 RepID=A0A5C5S3F3_9ACTN|nr:MULTISPECIES: diiron oxygenase [Tsukamurella]NMD57465.1 diiron oxygenase [Tsukamurella columbiensis]TWS29976.1 diiron oxygenase [Tsukamurella conjunctivitidis]